MSNQLKPPVSQADHEQGTVGASIEIVEYGDFQCSYCGAAYLVIKKIQQVFGNQIRFVFRNFPLTEVHPQATIAATAAEAAAQQHKYWEMHDLIYANQAELNEGFLYQLAQQLGLETTKFEKDMQDQSIQAKIESDFESGMRSGVSGTPTFFVNGQKFDGGAEDLLGMLKENAA